MTIVPRHRLGRLCACALLAVSGAAPAAIYTLPASGDDLVGTSSWTQARPGDNLATIAYRHGLGFRQLIHANPGLDPWRLPPQQRILLPTSLLLPQGAREGIVVNVPEMRLYYYPSTEARVLVFPVAVGRVNWKTPLGTTTVLSKVRNPVWYPPESIRAEHAAEGDPLPRMVPPGADNPLGHLALRLGWSEILIHGTNKPMGGIGMPVTHGCVRLYPQDIETLFAQVPIGTRVRFVDQPYKLGRHSGRWHLEAHAPVGEDPHATAAAIDINPMLVKLKARADSAGLAGLDWRRVEAVLRRSTGVPVAIDAQTPALLPVAASPPPSPPAPGAQPAAPGVRPSPSLLALGFLVFLALLAAGLVRLRGLHGRNVAGGARGSWVARHVGISRGIRAVPTGE